jgi:hypothetical protein
MRALAFIYVIAMVPLMGCSDQVRVAALTPGPNGTFTFSAHTNTVMTANGDGVAERIRRTWLAEAVGGGLCRQGYVVDNRQFVQPQSGLFGNGGEIVYTGRCL